MSHRTDDRFFRVPRHTASTSEGPVELPILYYDVTNVVALFEVPTAGVEELLEATGLVPALARRGHTMAALSFYEYRQTTVGIYNEVGLAVFVTPAAGRRPRLGPAELYLPPKWRRVGAYVVDLPVTTAAANAAGRELWGYPKFVTEIPFELAGRRFRSAVIDPDDDSTICELAGELGPGLWAPPMSLVTFTMLEGALLRTHVDVRGVVRARLPGSARLRIGSSEHRMAENLRTLGLDDATPRLVLVTDRFQSKLHAGRPVA